MLRKIKRSTTILTASVVLLGYSTSVIDGTHNVANTVQVANASKSKAVKTTTKKTAKKNTKKTASNKTKKSKTSESKNKKLKSTKKKTVKKNIKKTNNKAKNTKKKVEKKVKKKVVYKWAYKKSNKKIDFKKQSNLNISSTGTKFINKGEVRLGNKVVRVSQGYLVNSKFRGHNIKASALSIKGVRIKNGLVEVSNKPYTGEIIVTKKSNTYTKYSYWLKRGQVIKYEKL